MHSVRQSLTQLDRQKAVAKLVARDNSFLGNDDNPPSPSSSHGRTSSDAADEDPDLKPIQLEDEEEVTNNTNTNTNTNTSSQQPTDILPRALSDPSIVASEVEEEERAIRQSITMPHLPRSAPANIDFAKQDVPARSTDLKESPLTSQLQRAYRQMTGGSIADSPDRYSNLDPYRVARPTGVKCTVYLPHDASEIVQLEAKPQCTAEILIEQVLKQYRKEHAGNIHPEMSLDTFSYRLYVAEEDGEIDDDCPPLDDRCLISSTNSETFALRRKQARIQPMETEESSVSQKVSHGIQDSEQPYDPDEPTPSYNQERQELCSCFPCFRSKPKKMRSSSGVS